jgi:hypothetical protein
MVLTIGWEPTDLCKWLLTPLSAHHVERLYLLCVRDFTLLEKRAVPYIQ